MTSIKRLCVFIAAGALLLVGTAVHDVQAVVKDQKVTGLPPNTTVTITLPDGTTEEEETDDDGVLFYPFPKGNSTVSWPGGSKVVSPGWSTKKKAGVTGGSIVGAAAVVAAADDSSSGGGGGAGSSPPPSGAKALRVDNSSTASSLGVSVGDTIPVTCISGLTVDPVDSCPCDHGHGTIGVAVLSRTSPDFDPGACGHGCVVTTSTTTVTCP